MKKPSITLLELLLADTVRSRILKKCKAMLEKYLKANGFNKFDKLALNRTAKRCKDLEQLVDVVNNSHLEDEHKDELLTKMTAFTIR